MPDQRPNPAGSHIAYWRQRPEPGGRAVPLPPLEPLDTGQITGLIVVATLIAMLVLFSAAWWVNALHR